MDKAIGGAAGKNPGEHEQKNVIYQPTYHGGGDKGENSLIYTPGILDGVEMGG